MEDLIPKAVDIMRLLVSLEAFYSTLCGYEIHGQRTPLCCTRLSQLLAKKWKAFDEIVTPGQNIRRSGVSVSTS